MRTSEAFRTEVVDDRFLNVTIPGKPGRVLITLESEKLTVEIYPELSDEPVVETWATFRELELEKES
jgi:hypothetical protein